MSPGLAYFYSTVVERNPYEAEVSIFVTLKFDNCFHEANMINSTWLALSAARMSGTEATELPSDRKKLEFS